MRCVDVACMLLMVILNYCMCFICRNKDTLSQTLLETEQDPPPYRVEPIIMSVKCVWYFVFSISGTFSPCMREHVGGVGGVSGAFSKANSDYIVFSQ